METQSNKQQGGTAESPGEVYSNHLAAETSPYLKQHASNPVDWYPWGDEALDRAKSENKPILLSIGYSACHWCHVMERESFTDPDVAAILNDSFVSIKVDREERPDLDEIYMTAVQLLTGGGGWPLNVLLTPDLEPFFGGTYFPPTDGHGRPGFKGLLQYIAKIWLENPEQVASSAANLTQAIHNTVERSGKASVPLNRSLLANATESLDRSFDARWGGFGAAPKFPPSGSIALLLRQHRHTGLQKQMYMATVTLDRMAQGGMYDQVGGGFHRYSVDERWLIPHFEKMLYDNALLARVYLEAALVSDNPSYHRVARETLDFVLRDMTDASGGFHCALDADSEGEEGLFYAWSRDEIESVLGEENAGLFCEYFRVTDAGNFEGRNVLHYSEASAESVRAQFDSQEELDEHLRSWCDKLRKVRDSRVWPGKDDKVLAAWNGMAISALARGYSVLKDKRYLKAAERAADFVLKEMSHNGALLHSYCRGTGNGDSRNKTIPAFLDDYAEMANALIDLYEVSFDGNRLTAAIELANRMISEFHDSDGGGFFFTSAAHDNLLVRTKPYHDGAVPAGNSTAALVLLRLSRFLDDDGLREKAEGIFSSIQEMMSAHPQAFTHLLCAADFFLDTPSEIVLVGQPGSADTEGLLSVVRSRFAPNEIVALLEPGQPESGTDRFSLPLLDGKTMINGAASAYVCRDYACSLPVSDAAELSRLLAERE